MPTPFETIAAHCIQNGKNDCIRDLAYSIYRQQFESLTENKTPPMDAAAVQATQSTLLARGSLIAHTREAEEMLRKELETETKKIKESVKRDSALFAIATGIVGNIIYSLLLIVLFIVAKDQLSSWLSSLVVDKPQIVDQQNKEKPKAGK